MRKQHALVFDEYIALPSLALTDFTTSPVFSSFLATDNQMFVQVVVDDVHYGAGTNVSLSAFVETSPDQLDWVSKSGTAAAVVAGLANGGAGSAIGWDNGTLPSLQFARIRVSFTGVTTLPGVAHVRVYTTMRDPAMVVYDPGPLSRLAPTAPLQSISLPHQRPESFGPEDKPSPGHKGKDHDL